MMERHSVLTHKVTLHEAALTKHAGGSDRAEWPPAKEISCLRPSYSCYFLSTKELKVLKQICGLYAGNLPGAGAFQVTLFSDHCISCAQSLALQELKCAWNAIITSGGL